MCTPLKQAKPIATKRQQKGNQGENGHAYHATQIQTQTRIQRKKSIVQNLLLIVKRIWATP